MKEELKENIENILKNLKYFSFGCCVGWKCRKQSFGV
jgi:hypothetical protein